MDERINRVAALANISAYDAEATRRYLDGAPHIKHAGLRALYGELVVQIFDFARQETAIPTVLDLGAGEGSVTLPFLELGAKVLAVDISESQLDALRKKCERFGSMLDLRCEDINDTLREKGEKYDIVVASSFLHHVPDYMRLVRDATTVLTPYGQFFSFQDPLRYDSVGKFTMMFSNMAYFSWRVFKGDVIGGLKRRLRRSRGIYLEDSMFDNAEYHIVRNGVDQDAIYGFFKEQSFDCVVINYFSTQSPLLQRLGTVLGLKNTFAVVARKRRIPVSVEAELGQGFPLPGSQAVPPWDVLLLLMMENWHRLVIRAGVTQATERPSARPRHRAGRSVPDENQVD